MTSTKRNPIIDEKTKMEQPAAKHKKSQQQRKYRAGSLNLKSVLTISFANDFITPFVLESTENDTILRTRNDVTIMKLKKLSGNHQSKFQLVSESFAFSRYNVAETLKIDKKSLFNKASLSEKCDIMLDPNLLPDCLPPTTQLLQSLPSPSFADNSYIIASLTSHGSLTLSKCNYASGVIAMDQSNSIELCELRRDQCGSTPPTKLEQLQQMLKKLRFCNFDWCPQLILGRPVLVALTRSREIVFYGVEKDGSANTQFSQEISDETITNVKWVQNGEQHFLIGMNRKGNWYKYKLHLEEGCVKSIEQQGDAVHGSLNLPISHVDVLHANGLTFLLCVKAHSLEIFNFNGDKNLTVYIGLSITGITSIHLSQPSYLISTLNNEIHYLELKADEKEISIIEFVKVETAGAESTVSKFGAYGISTSKNKVLTFIAMQPQISSDHLTLKQPLNLSVNLFSLNSPHEILLNNQSLKLTDFCDCVEAVRFLGTNKLDTLSSLETMDYDIALDDKFLYYLKLQLIVIESKIVYYQIRSDTLLQLMENSELSIKKIIEVINVYKNLKRLIASKKNVSAIPAMVAFIAAYLKENITKEPFKTAQAAFKAPLLAITDALSQSSKIFDEVCEFCCKAVDKTTLMCEQSHPVNRCSITKLRLNITTNNCCESCKVVVADAKTLQEVTGVSENVCPYCDGYFEFNC